MKWLNLAVKPHFSWPDKPVEIPFEGNRIVLSPLTEELACTVSLFNPTGVSFEKAGTLIGRFLSRLAWSMNGGVVELFAVGSNNPACPGRLGRSTYGISGCASVRPWNYLYLPEAPTREADLALGLFREGMSVNSVPFSFLSYFKVLNVAFDGHGQIEWIDNNLNVLWYQPAIDRLQTIQRSVSNVGEYLYGQGRCAVAHAFDNQQLVNPDSYEDKRRLELDMPLIKELSALFIEQEFGVLSDSSFSASLKQGKGVSHELLRGLEAENGEFSYVAVQLR